MRLVLAVLAVFTLGCRADDTVGDPGGFGPTPPPGGFDNGDCTSTTCGDEVCSRTGVCLPAEDVHEVKTQWTVNGMPASTITCVNPDLQITFTGGGGNWGYAPVPCMEGQFTIDEFPVWFDTVELGPVSDFSGISASIDPSTGIATIDLTE
jgi:hypothetical protein